MGHSTDRTSAVRSRPYGDLLAILLLACGVCLVSGCSVMSGILGNGGDSEPAGGIPRAEGVPIEDGVWTKGKLHCAIDRCEDTYILMVRQRSKLAVKVFAPYGEGAPDFELVLKDGSGSEIARPRHPEKRPRTIETTLDPGPYTLVIRAIDDHDTAMKYELLPNLVAPPPTIQVVHTPDDSDTPDDDEPPAQIEDEPEPPPGEVVATLEVLGFDQDGEGNERFVLLDSDPNGVVQKDMMGRLVDPDGGVIGDIQIVGVFSAGSRAKLLGEVESSEVGVDTIAEILR